MTNITRSVMLNKHQNKYKISTAALDYIKSFD